MPQPNNYAVKDISLAAQGANQMILARERMEPLLEVATQFKKTLPFKGLRIGMALHVTKETGVLVETLQAGGAEVAIASCNPLSTQDDVAAYLAKKGVAVFAYKGESKKDYYKFIQKIIAFKPHLTIDDGCDLVTEIHQKHPELIKNLIGGCEETTTGIIRLRAMEADKALHYPVVAVNDNQTKHLFDNYYGTGQSTWDGILRATNVLIAGKTVVVVGYGDCGRGVARRAAGMGAHVIVTEVKPVRALQAHMDGYEVMTMAKAAPLGDIFITVTGNKHVIRLEHMKAMRSGAIVANSGHFNTEIDLETLAKKASARKQLRPFVEGFTLGSKTLYILGEGRLINLAAAEGHPSEVMALSFCGQALACEWLVKERGKLAAGVHLLPPRIDEHIGAIALKSLGVSIDKLTPEQKRYLSSWQEGT
ncbi:adenosylhomocysteinase [Candidatus Peregrinibacteria bacterium CG_4_9_14_0_2_um_filter_53_11]|nr:MAG: adenosylhomocysteinase [Candidatus Peregrinibacteria bacterium CG_4_9_14_0_2_um_filter_53_11]